MSTGKIYISDGIRDELLRIQGDLLFHLQIIQPPGHGDRLNDGVATTDLPCLGQLVSALASQLPLDAGDLILTGATPETAGAARAPLSPGTHLEVDGGALGVLANDVQLAGFDSEEETT